ncbi:MAG TPA: ATP-binding protein [Urbifossiella sp.]|nr:ATP-binding protein [Urbifossiella sp.]
MRHFLLSRYSGPLVVLGGLLAAACLGSTVAINRLQTDLARTVRHDAARMEAAGDLQVWLRQLRFHAVMFATDPSPARRWQVAEDRRLVTAALADARHECHPEDLELLDEIGRGYREYEAGLGMDDRPGAPPRSGDDFIRWADAHPVQGLLVPCRELADRQRERMDRSVERSEAQATWAGRVLVGLGLAGALGGVLSGFATARGVTRRVARLSVRVQAVQAHLGPDVGEMTVELPQHFGALDEQLDRVVGRVKDVCGRLQDQQRELLRAEQLAAVGQLAAGVAHEVRNPLTGIKFLVEAALRPGNPTPLDGEDLRLIRQEIVRMERTVQDLLDYARTPPPDRHPRDLRALVTEAAKVAASRAERKQLVVRLDLPAEPAPADVDRDQLLSVLTNLLYNAIDATPPGGDVAVEVGVGPGAAPRVTITDTGRGIDPAVADRLFTPFATTKPTGTGLGLTVARRVARDHGGTLTAANRPGGGACFTLTLPAAEAPRAEAAGR